MSEQVLVSVAGGVSELRLNRPDKRNAITLAMYDALTEGITAAEKNDSVRVILISGAGACFTAGNDLKDFMSGPPLGAEHSTARFIRLLPNIGKPVIAAVHGATVGIGATMLLHCDLVVAARSARLSMPFVRLGLVPEAASSLLLPRRVGYARAAELLLLGSSIDAATALSLGLVNRVTDDERLMDEARTMARELAGQPPQALRAARKLLRGESTGVSARIEEELLAFEQRLGSDEFRAAAQAFFAKGRQ
jgi:enoyl-CoA hydratase/carnithine racemase